MLTLSWVSKWQCKILITSFVKSSCVFMPYPELHFSCLGCLSYMSHQWECEGLHGNLVGSTAQNLCLLWQTAEMQGSPASPQQPCRPPAAIPQPLASSLKMEGWKKKRNMLLSGEEGERSMGMKCPWLHLPFGCLSLHWTQRCLWCIQLYSDSSC